MAPPIDIKKTSNRIKKMREERGLSVLEVATHISLTPQAIYRWESGNAIPSVDNLVALAEIFGVTIDDIVARKEAKNP